MLNLDLIIGCFFALLAVGILITGITVAIRRGDGDQAGYCALGIFPMIIAFFFLTTCDGNNWITRNTANEQHRNQQQMDLIKNEQAKIQLQIELARLEIKRLEKVSELPVEKPISKPETKPAEPTIKVAATQQ